MFDFQWTKAFSNYYRNQPSWTVQKSQSISENNNTDCNFSPCDSQFQSYLSTGDIVKNVQNLSEELGLILSISTTDRVVHLLWITLSWAKWAWWCGYWPWNMCYLLMYHKCFSLPQISCIISVEQPNFTVE